MSASPRKIKKPSAKTAGGRASQKQRITGQARAAKAPRESAERLSRIFHDTDECMWLASVEEGEGYRFQTVNDSFLRVTGLTRDQVLHRRLEEWLPSDCLALTKEKYREAVTTGRPVHYEEAVELPAGHRVREISLVPILDAAGACSLLLGIARDITGVRRAEADLRASETRLARAQQLARLGSYEISLTPNGSSHWSDETFRILGLDPAEKDRSNQEYICQIVHPDDRQRVKEAVGSAVRECRRYEEEYRIVRPDGAVRYVQSVAEPVLGPDGKLIKFDGFLQDITERQQAKASVEASEERFRELVESTRMIAWERPVRSSSFTYVSNWAVEALGYPLTDWARPGFFRTHIVHPADLERMARETEEGIRARQDFELEYRVVSSAGQTLWFRDVVHVENGPAGPETLKGFLIDITRRKAAQEAMRTSEERLRLVLEASRIGMFEVDLVRHESIWNTVEFELLGLRPGEISPTPEAFFSHVHPDDLERIQASWKSATQTGEFDEEFRIVRADGEVRWLAGKGRFVFEGEVPMRAPKTEREAVRFVGVNFDITERKEAEEKVRAGELRLKLALEGGDLGLWDWDVRTGAIIVNERWCSMLGYRLDEIEPHARSWEERLHPDDRPKAAKAWAEHSEGLTPKFEVECRLKHKDGTWIWVLDRGAATSRDANGQPLRACGTHMDITKRKEAEDALRASEERFRQVTETIDQVFWMTSVDKKQMLYISPGYERIWGRTCQSLYEAPLTWLDAMHPEDRELFLEAATSKQARGEYDVQYRIERPDGTQRWIHDRAFPVRDASGNVLRIAGVAEDITEHRRLEAEVLGISDYEQQRIGKDLHDDLCQQLVGLEFRLETLRQEVEDSPAAHEETLKIGELLRRATKHARTMAHVLSPVGLDPQGLMLALERLAADSALLFRIECRYQCEDTVSVADHVAATHLYRIAQEAITNAFKHGRARHVLVVLAPTKQGGRLMVTDDGRGCPLPIPAGGGMGVSIMRYRAAMIGATLHLEPAPGGGLGVVCDFPTHAS